MSKYTRPVAIGLATAAAAALSAFPVMNAAATAATVPHSKHVVLISIDGMHQSDLTWFTSHYPHSTLAQLVNHGVDYTNAVTSNPSDSDPGGTALMTGGNPKSTGVYYDVEYSHGVLDPTATSCVPGQKPTGGAVVYDSPDDALANVPDFTDSTHNPSNGSFPSFDENGSIYGGANHIDSNPAKILGLKNNASSFNWFTFPVSATTCNRISPWDYLADNTIFQVIHAAHLRTAWSDKHAIYMSFNGPGSNGKSIDDFFGPEIDSQAVMPNGTPYLNASGGTDDWAHIDAATKQYDAYKVKAVLNEIDGYNHARTAYTGAPAILGMNFQAVSVAQKLPLDSADLLLNGKPVNYANLPATGDYSTSAPEQGGYTSAGVPGPVLSKALNFVNNQVARLVAEVKAKGLASSTTFIITAKHGQSPTDPTKITTVKDGPIIDALNQAWCVNQGNTAGTCTTGLANGSIPALIIPNAGTDDDLWQSYLSDRSAAACKFAQDYLWNHSASGWKPTFTGGQWTETAVTVQHSGLSKLYGCASEAVIAPVTSAQFFGSATSTSPIAIPVTNGHNPDLFGVVQEGVIYTGKGKKLAEHGGMNPQDRHVLMIVDAPGFAHAVKTGTVETTQVAPTILQLLGLNPYALRAVRVEGTHVLPGL